MKSQGTAFNIANNSQMRPRPLKEKYKTNTPPPPSLISPAPQALPWVILSVLLPCLPLSLCIGRRSWHSPKLVLAFPPMHVSPQVFVTGVANNDI